MPLRRKYWHVEQGPREGKAAWEVVLQVAGGVTGLAAFTYLVGAIIMWIRLTTLHFPADFALGLMPHSVIVVLGIGAVAVVTAIVSSLLLVAHLVARLLPAGIRRVSWPKQGSPIDVGIRVAFGVLFAVVPQYLPKTRIAYAVEFWAVMMVFLLLLRRLSTGAARRWVLTAAAGAGLGALVISSLTNWRGFGVLVALILATPLILWYPRSGQSLTRWLFRAGMLASIAFAAVAWQANGPIHFNTVRLCMLPASDQSDTPLPCQAPPVLQYGSVFPVIGETSDAIYVAQVVPNSLQRDGTRVCQTQYPACTLGQVVEIRRDTLSEIVFKPPRVVYPSSKSPASDVLDWLQALGRSVKKP